MHATKDKLCRTVETESLRETFEKPETGIEIEKSGNCKTSAVQNYKNLVNNYSSQMEKTQNFIGAAETLETRICGEQRNHR